MADVVFKNWDEEKHEIAEQNKAEALFILRGAGISSTNPQYRQYYRTVLRYIHDCQRFGKLNDKYEMDIIKMLLESEGDIKQFAKKEILWKQKLINHQIYVAKGEYAYPDSYENIQKILNETITNGMRIRKKRHTIFPREFYDAKGGLKRLVYKISPVERNSGAEVVEWVKDRYQLNFENGKFYMKTGFVRPVAFFQTRAMSLRHRFYEKLQSNPQLLDLSDTELLDTIKTQNYDEFRKLNRQRGAANHLNKILRNILTDNILFQEFRHIIQQENLTVDSVLNAVDNLINIYDGNASLIRHDASKEKWGTVIDRIMLSVIPADVARQSTYKDWKNCMHATGLFHEYVDDSIGIGSIVAYGYNSHNPHKMLSRVLIHPYMKINTEVCDQDVYYVANPRVYGEENSAFNVSIEKILAHFNEGKEGIFAINYGVDEFNEDEGAVYIDSTEGCNVPSKVAIGNIDLDEYTDSNGNVIIDMDLSHVTSLSASAKTKEVKFFDVKFPDNFDLSKISNAVFFGETFFGKNCRFSPQNSMFDVVLVSHSDLANMPNLSIENMCKINSDVKLPQQADLSKLANIKIASCNIPDGYDFSACSQAVFMNCQFGENIKTGEYSEFRQMKIPENTDFNATEEVVFYNSELASGVDISSVSYRLFKGSIKLNDNIKGLDNISVATGASFLYNGKKVEYNLQQAPFKYPNILDNKVMDNVLLGTIKDKQK